MALRGLADIGVLTPEDAEGLVEADRLWRTIQGMLRMTVGRVEGQTLPLAAAEPLLAATGGDADVESLLARMDGVARWVHAKFGHYAGHVAS
jgi:glutamate-ammonia-ligase adenylyltransferase